MKTLRLHPAEIAIIDGACDVLEIDRATLLSDGAQFEATRLGIRFSTEPVAPLTKSWPYAPDRGKKPTEVRVTITMNRLTHELVARAAQYTHTSEPIFIIGATLAYIGRVQKTFLGTSEDTPEEAREIQRKLEAIKLPPQFQYRRARR
jgi:hypothetical protein